MMALVYALGVLWGFFSVGVVLAMFGVASTKFETVVVAGLTLIYLSVVESAATASRENLDLTQTLDAFLIRVLRALNDPSATKEEKALSDSIERHKRTNAALYIRLFFDGVLGLIAAVKLLSAALK
jgi:hypothetical protein